MDPKQAIDIIKSNWPPDHYHALREALTLAIRLLEIEKDRK